MKRSERIYRWLLRLYPGDFRDEYGHEMSLLFRARAAHGPIGLWCQVLGDLLFHVDVAARYFREDMGIDISNGGHPERLRVLLVTSNYFRTLRADPFLGPGFRIEDEAGALSYWALRHPPGKPDFHHPAGFALELD